MAAQQAGALLKRRGGEAARLERRVTRELYKKLEEGMLEAQQGMGMYELSLCMWSLSCRGGASSSAAALVRLADIANERLGEWDSEVPLPVLVRIALTCGKANLKHTALLKEVFWRMTSRVEELHAVQLSTLMWVCGTLEFKPVEFMAAAKPEVRRRLGEFRDLDLCNVALGLAQLGLADDETAATVAASAAGRLEGFSPLAVVRLLSSMAHSGCWHWPLMEASVKHAKKRMRSGYAPALVADLVWAWATLAHGLPPEQQARWAERSEAVLAEALEAGRRGLRQMRAASLTRFAWGCARLGRLDLELASKVAEVAALRLPKLDDREASLLAWAISRGAADAAPQPLTGGLHRFLRLLLARVARQAQPFDGAAAVNVMVAVGRMRLPPDLPVESEPEPRRQREAAQAAQNGQGERAEGDDRDDRRAAGSSAGGKGQAMRVEDAVMRLAEQLQRSLDGMTGHQVATVLWALARVGVRPVELLDASADFFLQRMDSCAERDLAQLLWCYGQLGFYHDRLFELGCVRLASQMAQLDDAQRLMLVQSLVTARHYDPQLLDHLVRDLDQRLHNRMAASAAAPHATPPAEPLLLHRNGVTFVHACAVHGHLPAAPGALPRLLAWLLQERSELSVGSLTSLAWSAAILDLLNRDAFAAIAEEIAGRWLQEPPHSTQLAELFYAQMLLVVSTSARRGVQQLPAARNRSFRPDAAPSQPSAAADAELSSQGWVLPPLLHQAGLAAWVEQRESKPGLSRLHRQVSETFDELGIPHLSEFCLPGMPVPVDIALVSSDFKIAVEVDGPHHYTQNWPIRELGATTARKRLLQHQDWQVAIVPFYTWQMLRSQNARETFICDLLEDVLDRIDA